MRLTHLSLYHFRSFSELELDLPPGIVLLRGDNGAGKSNLLEACYLLAITKSHRAASERELLNWSSSTDEAPYLRVGGTAMSGGGAQVRVQVDVQWPEGMGGVNGALPSKRIRVNGLPRRASDALGTVSAVLFTADDISIVLGAPAGRRRFLDILLSQLDSRSLRALQQYQQVLRQRNHLLRLVREGRARQDQLAVWDSQMAQHGGVIMGQRRRLVDGLHELAGGFYAEMAGGLETLDISYVPSVEHTDEDEAGLTDLMLHQLEGFRKHEVEAGQSLVGPHRDEVRLLVAGVPLAPYGSRGQARSAALALRLAEARLLAKARGEEPILLLDDLFSELDPPRRRQVLEAAARAEQALITTADVAEVPEPHREGAALFLVTPGAVWREQ